MKDRISEAAPPAWRERFAGGSQEAEARMIARLAQDMRDIQTKIAGRTGKSGNRTLHAKMIAGLREARLHVDRALPADFAAGYFQPGVDLPVTIRFSNASPLHGADAAPDVRGVALRVESEGGVFHDLLMTSFPVSHARDARQFVEIAKIATGPKKLILPRLLLKFGLSETRRIITNIKSGAKAVDSLATVQFWSRAPLLWGQAGPVRYALRPVSHPPAILPNAADRDYLAAEFADRLAGGDVVFRLSLQRFVDESRTPIEDGAVEWLEQDSPFIDVASLTIPRQDLRSAEARAAQEAVNGLAFNPWNCPEPFRPLGSLNRARGPVYAASAEGWLPRRT